MANNSWIPANPVASFPSWTKFTINRAIVSLLYPWHYSCYPFTLLIIEVKFCEGSWIIWRVGSTAHHTHLLDSKENSRCRRRPPLLLLSGAAAAAATSSMFFCFALHCFFWDQAGQAESQNLRMRCVFLQTRFPLCAILAIDLKKGPL